MRDGHRSECKACNLAQKQRWYRANRSTAIARVKRWQQENKDHLHAYRREYRKRRKSEERNAYLLRTFGISSDQYECLLDAQGGRCAICGRPPKSVALHVDHATGVIRGLLCIGCNNALGQFRDNTELLARASSYIVGGLVTFEDVRCLHHLTLERAGELRTSSV